MATGATAFARVQTPDRVINQLQDNIGKAVNNLQAIPFSGGLLLTGVELTTGDNTIYTQLPARLVGWIVTGSSAAASIYDKQSSNTNPMTLILNTSGDVTINLFVF